MTDNLRIWSSLGKTDPKHTKRFKRQGGFEGTSIKPIYHDQKMTDLFGPVGIGWGITEPTFQLVNGADGEVAVFCWLSVWYRDPATGERSDPIPGVGGDFVVKKNKYGLTADDEAFKKATTDAIGNATKHLGAAADVHMGQHDDDKYVTALRRELDEEERPKQRAAADDPRELFKTMARTIDQQTSLPALNTIMREYGERQDSPEPAEGSSLARLPAEGRASIIDRANKRRGVLAQGDVKKVA